METRTGKKSSRRRPGRQPSGSVQIDRDTIIACGLELSKEIPLQNLTVVRVAEQLGITHAMIHYHFGGREDLTSSIVNRFVRDQLNAWPRITGRWRADIEAVVTEIFRHFVKYPGIAAYFAGQNRFQILVTAAESDDNFTALEFLERYFDVVSSAGLDQKLTATYAVLMIQFVHGAAYHTTSHHWPGEQKKMPELLARLPKDRFPKINQLRDDYLSVVGETAFMEGLHLLMSGIAAERRGFMRKKRVVGRGGAGGA